MSHASLFAVDVCFFYWSSIGGYTACEWVVFDFSDDCIDLVFVQHSVLLFLNKLFFDLIRSRFQLINSLWSWRAGLAQHSWSTQDSSCGEGAESWACGLTSQIQCV